VKRKLLAAILLAAGILLADHSRDIAMMDGMLQAVVPGLALVCDMLAAAVVMTWGWA
jgi:hypothetical protein